MEPPCSWRSDEAGLLGARFADPVAVLDWHGPNPSLSHSTIPILPPPPPPPHPSPDSEDDPSDAFLFAGVGEVMIERKKTEKELAREAKQAERARRNGKGSSDNLAAAAAGGGNGPSSLRKTASVPAGGDDGGAAAAAGPVAADSTASEPASADTRRASGCVGFGFFFFLLPPLLVLPSFSARVPLRRAQRPSALLTVTCPATSWIRSQDERSRTTFSAACI